MKHRSKNESYRRFDSRHSWFSGFLIFLPIVIHSCASTVHAQSPASPSTSTPIVFSTQKIVLCALGASVATPPEGITAEVVAVKDFDELKSLPREKVAGKIVLFNYPFDKQMAAEGRGGEAYGQAVVYRSDGPGAAARQGAVACLIRSVGGADYRIPHTGQTKYADDAPKIPAGAVTAEDADLIADLVRQGPVTMKLVLTPQTLADVESANVIGDIKGSEHPEQVVIASGHLDSWDLGTGAIDDGAGVAVSMEAANLIQQLHLRPKRSEE